MPVYHDIGTRIQALALFEAGIPINDIVEITQITKSSINRYCLKAVKNGYDPGAPTARKTARAAWIRCWVEIPQKLIQR